MFLPIGYIMMAAGFHRERFQHCFLPGKTLSGQKKQENNHDPS